MDEDRTDYRVELDNYSGPLDLLLYLIRREEVDIYDIPIAHITEHYLHYLELMTNFNINVAGEFLVMAATLMEIKSRMMAPDAESMGEEDEEDPRLELVRQLMEYKQFKEAAVVLTERAHERAERFERPGERVAENRGPAQASAAGVSLWALLEAFSRILDQTGARGPHTVTLDQIPQEQLHAELEERVREAGRLQFLRVFEGTSNRLVLIGMFLALLELVRQQVIRAEQAESFGEIWLSYVPPEERPAPIEPEAPTEAKKEPGQARSDDALVAQVEEGDEWLDEDADIEMPDVPDIAEDAAGSEGTTDPPIPTIEGAEDDRPGPE